MCGTGKYAHHTLSKLVLSDSGGEAKKKDLVHGATVRCVYAFSSGNGGNFGGGRRGGFGRFGGSFGRRRGGFGGLAGLSSRDAALVAMMLGGGFGGGGYSDDSDY